MKKNKVAAVIPGRARRQAEERLDASRFGSVTIEKGSELDLQRLLQEVQVHQVELEQQNDELQRSRTEVEEGLARYADLYEYAPVGYLTLGRDGVIRQVNLTAVGLLGQERSRMVGSRLGLLVAAKCRTVFNAFLVKVFDSQIQQACAVELSPEGAPPRALEITATASEDGQECRVIATDVTERDELRSQLLHAQKMEAIGTFAGGIAHDFNNILGGIQGGLSLLDLDLGESSHHHPDLQDMMALVERGADLTRQLLGFARRGKYDVRPVDMAHVIAKTIAMFGRTRRDITIDFDVAPGLRAVLMDHTQIQQVLLNLVINAGQAMPEGGKLHLFAENVELASKEVEPHGAAPGHYVKVVIADNGVGMDSATQARIFEPFFTTKGPGQGTGLGLASVYGIIKSHCGIITVESELGKGTSFKLFLPASEQQVANESAPAPSIKHGVGTILVVDDEEQIVKAYSRLLNRIGYDVLTASCGKEAIEVLRQHGKRISLVILDMIMPDMSGRQTYDALQKVTPGIKVLLATGFAIDGQAQDILAHGCNGFIQKPFDPATLSEKILEIL